MGSACFTEISSHWSIEPFPESLLDLSKFFHQRRQRESNKTKNHVKTFGRVVDGTLILTRPSNFHICTQPFFDIVVCGSENTHFFNFKITMITRITRITMITKITRITNIMKRFFCLKSELPGLPGLP